MDELHRRLFQIGATLDLGLVLAGGYALQAHEVLDRRSQDIDFATASGAPMTEIVIVLADAYRRAGFEVEIIESVPRMARLRLLAPELAADLVEA